MGNTAKLFAAGAGQSVSLTEINVRQIRLTAGSAAATAVLYSGDTGSPVAQIPLAALTGTSDRWAVPVSHGGDGVRIPGPVTLDVVGTGAQVRIDY